MQKLFKSAGIYLILIIIVLFVANSYFNKPDTPKIVKLDTFVKDVKAGNLKDVTVADKDHFVTYEKDGKQFKANFTANFGIADFLLENKVKFITIDPQRAIPWVTILINVLPFVLFFGLWMFMLQQMQGGGNKVMSFGKSKHKKLSKDQPRVTFKDVAGADEAIEELNEIKEFLANPAKFQSLGAKIPKGVLLFGPPGSGKTLLARAVAGEAGVPFFTISGSDFVEMFVGVGASRVRDLFEQAKANSPSIIFMDEIDAVGRHRGAGLGGGHDEREQTLNQLLVEMDGFNIKDNVILIAATNRPDILDPALLRPGRFDRQIVVGRPDLRGREGIFEVHTKGKPLAKNINVNVLARRTPGFTGADIANVVNEAALLSARHNKKSIEMGEMEEAIERVIAGPEKKSHVISEKEKKVKAYHETGHAMVAHMLPNIKDPVHKVSIIPRGMAAGYTLVLPTEDKNFMSKLETLDEIATLLGGRVAEEIFLGDITNGASNDLERATKMARTMVCEWGMSEKLGPLTLGQKQHEVFLGKDFSSNTDYSPEIAYEIDQEIRRIIDEGVVKVRKIMKENKARIEKVVEVLMEKETLEKDELLQLLGDNGGNDDGGPDDLREGEAEKAKNKGVKPKLGPLRPAES